MRRSSNERIPIMSVDRGGPHSLRVTQRGENTTGPTTIISFDCLKHRGD